MNNNPHSFSYIPKGTFEAMRIASDYQKTFKLQAELIDQAKPMIDAANKALEPIETMQLQVDAIQKMVEAANTQIEFINNSITKSYLEQLKKVTDSKVIDELNLMGVAIQKIVPLGWPYSKKYTRSVYLLASNMLDEVGEKDEKDELNQFFIEAVDEYLLPAIEKKDLQYGLGTDWNETIDYLLTQVHQNNLINAIPLILICIDRVFARVDGSLEVAKMPGDTRRDFDHKTNNENILSYLIHLNTGVLLGDLVQFKMFGKENNEQNILNRNRISHGKSNPVSWEVKDMYQMFTVLLCLCEVAEEYYYYLERGVDNE